MTEMVTVLFLLLAGHALADYPLQGDFLARGKNHKNPIPGIPFYHCLVSHALIHGGVVYLVTQSLWLGLAETVIHTAIDYGKCDEKYGLNVDQSLHVACKVLWVIILFTVLR